MLGWTLYTEYAPDYLQQCVTVLEETGADNVGGPWVAKGLRIHEPGDRRSFESPFSTGGARGHDATHEGETDTVYLVAGPVMFLIASECLTKN